MPTTITLLETGIDLDQKINEMGQAIDAAMEPVLDMTPLGKSIVALTDKEEIRSALGAAEATASNLSNLLVYYGTPISYSGLGNTTAVIDAIAGVYKYYVMGSSYQEPTHADYATTTTIVTGLRARGVKVFGYLPIGVSTLNRTTGFLKTAIDQWVTLGVDGILLDEFGFDYQVSRARQVEIVDYVHGKNLPVAVNATTYHDFVCDNVSELPWGGSDWRVLNFTTYNPANTPLTRNATDIYLIDDFCFSATGALGYSDSVARYKTIMDLNKTKNVLIWATAALPEATPGVPNWTNIPSTKDIVSATHYAAAMAHIFDIGVLGIVGQSFAASGTPITATLPVLPDGSTEPTADAVVDAVGFKVSRSFGQTRLSIQLSDATPATVNTSTITTDRDLQSAPVNDPVTVLYSQTVKGLKSFEGGFNVTGGTLASDVAVSFQSTLYVKGNLTSDGAISGISDVREKEEIQTLHWVLPRLLFVCARSYRWKNSGEYDEGVIAQELELFFPAAVHVREAVTDEQGNIVQEERLTVEYGKLGVYALAAIRELFFLVIALFAIAIVL